MKKYEVMYIIRPEVEEEERNSLIAEVNQVFTTTILLLQKSVNGV